MNQPDRSAAILVAALSPAHWYNLGLIAMLIALAVAAVLGVRAWQEAHEDVEPATPEELLASFEEARSRGELDEEEYAKVRERLGQPAPHSPPGRPAGPG